MNPGFTSNNGGVVISMTNFNSVSVSEDQKTVEVGAGLTWSKVYQELDPLNLAVTGGRIPSVGVSGLLLGGGLSFHRGTKGVSCNGVVEYEVHGQMRVFGIAYTDFNQGRPRRLNYRESQCYSEKRSLLGSKRRRSELR